MNFSHLIIQNLVTLLIASSIPSKLIKQVTTHTVIPASYLDLQVEIDNGGMLKTKRYHKRDELSY